MRPLRHRKATQPEDGAADLIYQSPAPEASDAAKKLAALNKPFVIHMERPPAVDRHSPHSIAAIKSQHSPKLI